MLKGPDRRLRERLSAIGKADDDPEERVSHLHNLIGSGKYTPEQRQDVMKFCFNTPHRMGKRSGHLRREGLSIEFLENTLPGVNAVFILQSQLVMVRSWLPDISMPNP